MLSRQKWTHRLAWTVVVVTLALPVTMGSLTTTLGAGMAFLDWPTSDGENMLFYNMLRDIREGNTDKVAEHGHRLAGMIVGLLSIPLAILGWRDGRPGVRSVTLAIGFLVLGQGVLGGARVLLDERLLAMLHSLGAAAIVALMALATVITSRGWQRVRESRCSAEAKGRVPTGVTILALATVVAVSVQFVAGGFVRHFGMALAEHLGGAVVVGLLALTTAMLTVQSVPSPLRKYGWGLFAAVALQVLLGFGAWAGKFGMAAFGVVAVERGVLQVTLRTLHTSGGMLLLATAVVLAFAVLRAGRVPARMEAPANERLRAAGSEIGRAARGTAVAGGLS